MFVCHCPRCGRRELRSARWLVVPTPPSSTWTTACRGCGAVVAVVDQRRVDQRPAIGA